MSEGQTTLENSQLCGDKKLRDDAILKAIMYQIGNEEGINNIINAYNTGRDCIECKSTTDLPFDLTKDKKELIINILGKRNVYATNIAYKYCSLSNNKILVIYF